MTGDVLALALGTLLAVGALAYVLYPLFFGAEPRPAPAPPPDALEEESAIRALREIEFDRATGKLSDPDYHALRATYAQRALRELRADAAGASAVTAAVPAAEASPPTTEDEIEARVRAYRASRQECGRCGLRPEPDAVYCSTCGDYLGGTCPACAAPVSETSAAFCSSCGITLAPQPA